MYTRSWYCTSLHEFPASDVMKMLTLVLVSSGPTTPGYKKAVKEHSLKTCVVVQTWNRCAGKIDFISLCKLLLAGKDRSKEQI